MKGSRQAGRQVLKVRYSNIIQYRYRYIVRMFKFSYLVVHGAISHEGKVRYCLSVSVSVSDDDDDDDDEDGRACFILDILRCSAQTTT